ncbi:MAG TPA: flavodoxin family protein [Cellvibrio sp.]|nr:flavodoxin family protein [Cellvibrio sp.]
MKLAVVLSSNRDEVGFSAKLLKKIVEFCAGQVSVDAIWLNQYRIELCDADNKCSQTNCAVKDDMEMLAERIIAADAVLYIPVVHAYGTCSRMQSFIERLGYGFMRPQGRPLQNKLALVAVVGRRYSHESVFSQMILNFLLNRCIIIGSGFPPTFRSELGSPDHDPEAWSALKTGLIRTMALHRLISEANMASLNKSVHLEEIP